MALQVPFYSEVNFFLTHTPMAVQPDTFAMSQATTTCPTTTTPMPAMLLASNKNMAMFLFEPKNLTPKNNLLERVTVGVRGEFKKAFTREVQCQLLSQGGIRNDAPRVSTIGGLGVRSNLFGDFSKRIHL